LDQNQDNMSNWSDVYLWTVVSVSYHYKNLTRRGGLVQSRHYH